MPEPRLIHMGGEILIGYKSGGSDAFGPYGHKPWQKGYKDEKSAINDNYLNVQQDILETYARHPKLWGGMLASLKPFGQNSAWPSPFPHPRARVADLPARFTQSQ